MTKVSFNLCLYSLCTVSLCTVHNVMRLFVILMYLMPWIIIRTLVGALCRVGPA